MTQTPPNRRITLGQLRQSTAYTASDTQVNITLRPVGDVPKDFPLSVIAYDRGVGVLDLIVDLPEGLSLVFAPSDEDTEMLRRKGIDAYNCGVDRGANPYSYEASRAWDSGWMQAQQAHIEALPEIGAAPPVDEMRRLVLELQELRDEGTQGPLVDEIEIDGQRYAVSIDDLPDDEPEITTPNIAWIAGANAPGDLPFDGVGRYASWWAAKEYLDRGLMDAAIEALDDGRNDDADRHHEARTDLANAEDGEGWCMLVCGQLWWLHEIADHG